MTRAVRAALAASAAALALAGSGAAFAGECTPAAGNVVTCTGTFIDEITYEVDDLTLVMDQDAAAYDGVTVTGTGDIEVSNAGDIFASGTYGATGIDVLASGDGATGSVTNSGSIYASQSSKYGYGAAGIVVSADADATIDNSGSITVVSGGQAYGAMALSLDGDASVANSGDIDVISNGSAYYYGAYGIVSVAQNGTSGVDNSGDISVASTYYGGYYGIGIQAYGLDGATVTNNGSVEVDAYYAYGVIAGSGQGDVLVENGADGVIDVSSPAGYAFGVLATAGQGDVSVANDGIVAAGAGGQSVGVFAHSSGGDVDVDNAGSIGVYSYWSTAAGVFGDAHGALSVDNAGGIQAYSYAGEAFGVLGFGDTVDVASSGDINANAYAFASGINVYGATSASVVNDGSISAYGVLAANGVYAGGGDSVHIENTGDIVAVSYGLATGIYGYSVYGDVSVDNSGYVGAHSMYSVADGIFASGANVDVASSGDIVAIGSSWGAGIEAQGADGTTVANSGSIYAYGFYGFGVYATGGDGGIAIANDGSIEAQGYIAAGVYAQGSGDIDITNAGDVVAGTLFSAYGYLYGSLLATGIHAGSNYAGTAIDIANSGTIDATAYIGAIGIEAIASGEGGTASVSNAGTIHASQYAKYGYGAAGIVVSADGDAGIDNSGAISVESGGLAYGALALSFNGDASVVNAGDIDVASTESVLYYGAYGIVAASQNGEAFVDNSGSVNVVSDYYGIGYVGMGIQAAGMEGATVTNSGAISVDARLAYGVYASSGAGDVSVTNTGDGLVDVYSYAGSAFGVLALANQGDVDVANAGVIDVYGYGQSVGVFTQSGAGDAYVVNSGDIQVASGIDASVGAFARALYGEALVVNDGTISVSSPYLVGYGALVRGLYAGVVNNGDIAVDGTFAFGAYADGIYGAAVATGAGSSIVADGIGQAIGVLAQAYLGGALVDNGGSVEAVSSDGSAFGVYAYGYTGASVLNSGDIHAEATDGNAIGVLARSQGDVYVGNSGTISASHPDSGIAVLMSSLAGDATLVNSGLVEGGVVAGAGDDLVANESGGTWRAGNFASHLGAGDDTITNASGGIIHLANGGIFMGAGENAFENAGLLQVSGYGLVHMGTAGSVLANDGMISLVDGGANDLFVVAGDLGGNGGISADADLSSGASDLVYIYGDVVAGTTQAINLVIDEAPTDLSSAFDVVAVTGAVDAGNFVGGDVFGFDPSNFLDLDVGVALSQAGGLNVVTASVDVAGLNDTGVLAASVAPGVHDLIASTVGTWRQRMGVQPSLDGGRVGIGPWVRFYTDDGDVSPEADGFSANRDFGFEQENRGREFGLNLAVGGGFNLGVLAGTADADQVLTGGVGSDRIDLDYSGVFGTWVSPSFYVDASMRWMDFDAVLLSAGGEQRTSGNATAFNVEAGYTGWNLGAFMLTPQVQYTRAKVDDIAPVSGSMVDFTADGGVSERVRLGLGFSRSFGTAGGALWTPYGAVSAVDELDGESRYLVDGNTAFSGTSSIDGTHALVEAGVGVQFGGLSVTGGLNWADGGAVDSSTGGQLVLRYTW